MKKKFKRFKDKLSTLLNLLKKPKNIKIQGDYFSLHNIKFDIDEMSNVLIELGVGVKLNGVKIYIRGTNHKIILGDNVRVSKGIFCMEDNDCLIQIGNNTTIESAQFACTEPFSSINVGDDCMFSHDIELRTGDSHSILDLNTQDRLNFAKNINIENRVWIGAHVKILKGVEIQSDVVVGLGSIVLGSKILKKNTIYSGVPAKCLKQDIFWSRKRILKNN